MGVVADSAIVITHEATQPADQPKFSVPENFEIKTATFGTARKSVGEKTVYASSDVSIAKFEQQTNTSNPLNNSRATSVVGKVMDAITGHGKLHSGILLDIYEAGFDDCKKVYSEWIKHGTAQYTLPDGSKLSGDLLRDLKKLDPSLTAIVDEYNRLAEAAQKPVEEHHARLLRRPKAAALKELSADKAESIAQSIHEMQDPRKIIETLSKLSEPNRKVVSDAHLKKYEKSLADHLKSALADVDRFEALSLLSETLDVGEVARFINEGQKGTVSQANLERVLSHVKAGDWEHVLKQYKLEVMISELKETGPGKLEAGYFENLLDRAYGFDAYRVMKQISMAALNGMDGKGNLDTTKVLEYLRGTEPEGRTIEQISQLNEICQKSNGMSLQEYIEGLIGKDSKGYQRALGLIQGKRDAVHASEILARIDNADSLSQYLKTLKPFELDGSEQYFNELYQERVNNRTLRRYLGEQFKGTDSKKIFDALDAESVDIGQLPQGKWSDQITAAAYAFNMEARLIESFLLGESSGDSRALGGSGEISLMQIMPRTGAMLGFSEQDLWDPDKNVLCGAKYLSTIMEVINETADQLGVVLSNEDKRALCCVGYNAGEDNAELAVGYMSQGKNLTDAIAAACNTPNTFRTRGYVNRIMNIYNRLEPDEQILQTEATLTSPLSK